jgi:hypothetical protein
MKEKIATEVASFLNAVANEVHGGHKGSCSIGGCPNNAIAKGYCNAHYIRHKRGLSLVKPVQAQHKETCLECSNLIGGKGGWGRCSKHYKALRQRTIKTALIKALGGQCNKCQGVFPVSVYDFHHAEEKNESPSFLIANKSLDAIADEISKCILLCANCHRIEHYER